MCEEMYLIRDAGIAGIRGSGYGRNITVTYTDGDIQVVSARADGTLYDLHTGRNIVTPEQIKYIKEMQRMKERRRVLNEIQRQNEGT